VPPTLDIEEELQRQGYRRIAGIDEAGRGCLAGPVVAAAVILPEGLFIEGVDDSKLIDRLTREALATEIRAKAVAVSVGVCTVEEVDALNILHAAMEAMRRAAMRLVPQPDYVLVDGNRCFPDPLWPWRTVVGGDALSHSIAAASIIAKTTRDRMMHRLHEEFPQYGWITNAGYATREHYRGIVANGITPHHRRSFRLEPQSVQPRS
jgi:ribonuclease HII